MSISPFFGEDPAPEQTLPDAKQQAHAAITLPRILRAVLINLLVLAELCVAMYMATQNPNEFTPVFFKVFFALLAPTLVLAFISKRFVRPKDSA